MIRAEISEIEIKKILEKIYETKSSFFEKIKLIRFELGGTRPWVEGLKFTSSYENTNISNCWTSIGKKGLEPTKRYSMFKDK